MKRNFKALFSIFVVMIILTSSLPVMTASDSQNKSNEKVDLAFVIDTTGSMNSHINNVKNNISDFATYLEDQGIDLRISIIEYRDIKVDGVDSTKVHKLDGSTWHYSTKDMINTLDKLSVDGGGDIPETVIDGLGYLDTRIMSYDGSERLGMSKYVKLYMESPQNVEVFIEDEDGNVVASIKNVEDTISFEDEQYTFSYVANKGFEDEEFRFHSTASDFEEGLNAIVYMPKSGYKVVFEYHGDEDYNLEQKYLH
ncbi:VWA domain-containing protein [Herbivorax sp. ANBcel31]|uniref:vWA domain-containing protein n=1 Tax=Herbivorax sp. ANBcel31 TaxID=3069754 RepID=UPI0027B4AF94|nr:vWA domain-containing protein [Herbivorax sp. ANBcel31]MDQ2085829.1 VWA domain-containing protein [Herbivorax sp. ANBcel31]